MAQGRVVKAHLAGDDVLSNLAESQRHRIQQYEKIVRFEDAILSGKHPSIKPPSNLIASAQSSTHPRGAAVIEIDAAGFQSDKSQYTVAKAQQPGMSASLGQSILPSSTPKASRPYGSGSTEINPIFLEKSDDLVKAELQLQRQRLERALRDEVEQRRVASKNVAQGEPIPDFDLNDVLSKALTLVQATAGPVPDDENPATTNLENASDSFDDNTFYSSQHNTPSSVLTSRVRNESEEAQPAENLESQPPINSHSAAISRIRPTDAEPVNLELRETNAPRPYQTYANPAANAGSSRISNTSRVGQVPGLTVYAEDKAVPGQDTSAGQSHSEESSNMEIDRHKGNYGSSACQHPRDHYIDSHPPSPLMRANERSPPHPTRTSPLTGARRPLVAAEATSNSSTGTPAQVAALRNEPIAVTSPESSPQGGRAAEKRKGKKKKRKADRQAPEAEPVPYIKPEPRSPSPMNAPSYIRPNKRQRYTQQQLDESGYEDVRYEPQTGDFPPEPVAKRVERDDRIPIEYERPGLTSQRGASNATPGGTVYRREYADERYVSGGPFVTEQPPGVSAHYREQSSAGRARSQVRPSDGYQRPSWPYQGPYEASPAAPRPGSEVYMAPPRPPPTRIIVDAFGREYIEPPRPTVIRHSVAPPARSGEPEIIYERPAPRAISRHAGMETYEGGALYRRPSPSYMPRRVVTQPEYVSQDFRDHRPREYSSRPMAPQGEFVEVMAAPERRRVEEGPREYITRAASVRPAEPIRYEVARDYGRVQSVRPEAAARQYQTSIHPESRREAAQPYAREYGALPAEQGVVRQEYSARPVERYYNQPMRGGEEIAFIERPRGTTQEIVYADDARREVYR
ncbi:hypothetical protein FALBO_12252 [Fusarium albosuccineum]|uniref:Uncharacterized protein n=1 Tax=Fusarium albosuccineum TaxID=1237068 RepID=A0A8H4P9A6_9HYPO|nr:hypothetical protein FALBO_12252 [Fusarium albosuccineum]